MIEKRVKKVKKPTREEMQEEIISLALTVKFLMVDVKYLLDGKGTERLPEIKKYISDLEEFLTGHEV